MINDPTRNDDFHFACHEKRATYYMLSHHLLRPMVVGITIYDYYRERAFRPDAKIQRRYCMRELFIAPASTRKRIFKYLIQSVMLNKIYDYPPTLARQSTPTSHKNYIKY